MEPTPVPLSPAILRARNSDGAAGSLGATTASAATAARSAASAQVTVFRRSLDLSSSSSSSLSSDRMYVANTANVEPTAASYSTGSDGNEVRALSQTRQPADIPVEHLTLAEVSEDGEEAAADIRAGHPADNIVQAVIAADSSHRGGDLELQSVTVESVAAEKGRHHRVSGREVEGAAPLVRPHPNWRNPNVDLSRGLSPPYPAPAAEPHVVAASLPWLQRWVDRRWRFLFPAYRRLDVCGLRGFSVCELTFIAVYSLVNLALVVSGIALCAAAPTHNDYQGSLYNTGVKFGTYGTINVLILLFPVARSSVIQYILGISFERAIYYHKWIARVAVAEFAIHGAAIYADSYYNDSLWADASDGGVTGVYGSGSIAFFVAVAIVVLSLYPFRRYLHELFLRVHLLLFVAFLVFGFIHDGTVALIVPALILYAVDWVLRISMWRQPVRVLDVRLLPGGVTRISFQKDQFTYQAGQYIFICLPAVSPFEWHPFSLSSSPHHPLLTVHCKSIGRWTRRLAELARRGSEEGRDWTALRMHTEGPYGQLSLPLAHYSSVLLVCGGIGVTPLGSVYNELVHEHYRGVRRLSRLKLVWSLREPALITSLYDDVRKAENVEAEERGEAAAAAVGSERPSSFFLHPRALAERDALVGSVKHNATPRTAATSLSSVSSTIHPLTGRINNAFHLTQLSTNTVYSEQVRGVQSYYGDWIKEGRPELAVAFSEMREAMTADMERLPTADTDKGAPGRCAVLACGPRMLIDDVRAFCIRQSTPQTHFTLHEETFSW